MLNKGVLALNSPLPGLRGHFMLTKTLEWNLRWCILDSMFDDRHFRVARGFINDPEALRQRFKCGALCAAQILSSPALMMQVRTLLDLQSSQLPCRVAAQ